MNPMPRSYKFYTDNEELREEFEEMFISWYWLRDVEQETWNGYLMRFKAHMNKIMPRYKEMFEISLIEMGLENVNLEEVIRQDQKTLSENESNTGSENTSESDSTTSSDSLVLDNDTPEGSVNISNIDAYVSGVTKSKGNDTGKGKTQSSGKSNAQSKGNVNDELDKRRTLKGYQGDRLPSELRSDLLDKCYNLNEMLIEDLSVLFFKIR